MGFNKVATPLKGDLLRVRRKFGYYHFGIAVNSERVIHFTGTGQDFAMKKEMKIIETPLSDFVKDGTLQIEQPYSGVFNRDEVVKRAKEFVGSNKFLDKYYNLVTNNCEHFARYCYDGKAQSLQVVSASVIAAAAGFMTSAVFGSIVGFGFLKKKSKQKTNNDIIEIEND
jgi:hypothetical protein